MSALGGVVVLRGGGMRSVCKASSRRRDLETFRGAYLVKRGSRGLGSGREGFGGGLLWRVCSHCKISYGEFASPPCGRSRRRGVSTHAWRRVGGGRRCWQRGRV